MRIILNKGVDIEEMRKSGALPNGVKVQTDEGTGRQYINYIIRLSDIDWEKLKPYTEATVNLVRVYRDFFPDGMYAAKGSNVRVIVTYRRNESSGVIWQEVEVYGKGASPEEIRDAHRLYRQGKLPLIVKWSHVSPRGILIRYYMREFRNKIMRIFRRKKS